MELSILKAEFDRLDGLTLGIGHTIDNYTIMIINGIAGPPNSLSVALTNIWIAFTSDLDGSAGGFDIFIAASERDGKFKETVAIAIAVMTFYTLDRRTEI